MLVLEVKDIGVGHFSIMIRAPVTYKLYSLFLIGALIGLLIFLNAQGFSSPWLAILFFGLLVFLAENLCVDLPKVAGISVSFAIFYAAAILYGPSVSAWSGVFAAVAWKDIRERSSPFRWLFNAGQYALSAGLAGLVYVSSGGPVLIDVGRELTLENFPQVLLPLMLLAVVFYVCNTGFVLVSLRLSSNLSIWRTWFINYKWLIPNYFALAPLGIALAQIYMKLGAPGVLLLLAPLFVARQTFQVYMKVREALFGTVTSLATAMEAKDVYTRRHSERVAEYAEMISRQLRLPEEKVESIKFAAALHDIGKIRVAKKILSKPTQLSRMEYGVMKKHPEKGAEILREVKLLEEVIPAVLWHHEHIDGQGYPDGLSGEKIPLIARILGVADAFDAMTSARPYRPPFTKEKAFAELFLWSGSQFDKEIVEALADALGMEHPPTIPVERNVEEEIVEKT